MKQPITKVSRYSALTFDEILNTTNKSSLAFTEGLGLGERTVEYVV